MDDWDEPADEEREPAAATGTVHRAAEAAPAAVDALAAFLADATSPAIVVGAGADDPESWAALVAAGRAPGRPGLPGDVRRPRRLSAGSPAVPGHPPGGPGRPARTARPLRHDPRRRRPRVPPVRLRARAPDRAGHAARDRHRRPGRAASQPRRRRAPGAARRVCAARSQIGCPRAQRDPPEPLALPEPPASSGARRAADGRPRALGARRAPAAGRGRARGGARRPARARATGCPRASRSAT